MQIRGYKIRLPLDVMLFASANPEDYTNRGRIITPLKDRFGAQIRTHYPLEVETEVDIAAAGGHGRSVRRRHRGRGARRSWPRSWPRSATWPARARTSTSARACRCASRCPTSRRWWPTPPAGRCSTARPTSCPGSATSRRWPRRPPARSRSSRSRRAATSRSSSTCCRSAVLTVFRDRLRHREPPRRARCLRRRGRSSAPARTSRRPTTSRLRRVDARAAPAGRASSSATTASPAAGGQRRRVRARGPAPLQAPQQGSRRRPRPVPQPLAHHPRTASNWSPDRVASRDATATSSVLGEDGQGGLVDPLCTPVPCRHDHDELPGV